MKIDLTCWFSDKGFLRTSWLRGRLFRSSVAIILDVLYVPPLLQHNLIQMIRIVIQLLQILTMIWSFESSVGAGRQKKSRGPELPIPDLTWFSSVSSCRINFGCHLEGEGSFLMCQTGLNLTQEYKNQWCRIMFLGEPQTEIGWWLRWGVFFIQALIKKGGEKMAVCEVAELLGYVGHTKSTLFDFIQWQ